ncbi:hypothetical protein ACFSQQ_21275 [Mesorhizobium kowhaii]|uniref:hypothetical protein n=1 Tax=Mesorhizobium kowhaii TaxID=1300272 RepID=UPI0035E63331
MSRVSPALAAPSAQIRAKVAHTASEGAGAKACAVETVEEAKAAVEALPLTAGGFANYELMHVGPLAPLGLLIQVK